ncbi:MAG TPA: hypothetical protein VKB62_05140, partial [Streptosporangiaceae bacterium]|nr:hypothetical protein [Streptosporangiaceae bacterium]
DHIIGFLQRGIKLLTPRATAVGELEPSAFPRGELAKPALVSQIGVAVFVMPSRGSSGERRSAVGRPSGYSDV